ncbi:MAG: IPT/TIG domain-containing protein, partial [Terriglobales bacterium]
PNFRFFTVNSGATLTLNQVNVSNGNLVAPNGLDGPNGATGADVFGGAIRNNGTTNITGGAFSGNSVIGGNGGNSTSTSGGHAGSGGNGVGGAINTTSTLSITGATFSGNASTGGNGGAACTLCVPGGGGNGNGGAIGSSGTVTISGATFTSNVATGGNGPNGAGTANGGALYDIGAAVTISGNTAFSQNRTVGGQFGTSTDPLGVAHGGAIASAGTFANVFHMTDTNVSQNSANGSIAEGGGIYYLNGALTLTNTTVSNNTATFSSLAANLSGTHVFGGGVYSFGSVTLTNSTLKMNQATITTPNVNSQATGGGIFFASSTSNLQLVGSTVMGNSVTLTADGTLSSSASAGGIATGRGLTMTNSTVSNNTVTNASAISGRGTARASGGGIQNGGARGSIITGSTISGNTLSAPTDTIGGGIYDDNTGHLMTITNSTLSGNTAATGGGAYEKSGQMAFVHGTVASNSSGVNADPFATILLTNTVLANTSLDCVGASGSYFSADYNLAKDHTCDAFLTGAHDQKGVDPNLDTLKLNAPGTTATHALLPGSPAIDTIPNTGGCNNAGVTTDQRGVARPQPAGGLCDIGSFEVQAGVAMPTVTAISPTSGPTTGGSPVTITGTGFQTGATVKFGTAPATGCAVVNSTTITCTTPPGSAGTVTVTVTNPDSQMGALAGVYTYGVLNPLPSPQPVGGTGGIPTVLPRGRPRVPVVGIPSPVPPRR